MDSFISTEHFYLWGSWEISEYSYFLIWTTQYELAPQPPFLFHDDLQMPLWQDISLVHVRVIGYVQRHFGLNTVVVFEGYESSNSTKVVEQQRRASKGVSSDLLFTEQIKAVSTQASFLANATNKSQLIAMFFTKFQHYRMSLRCLKIMVPSSTKDVTRAGVEFLLKLYGVRIVQTLDKHRCTMHMPPPFHDSIRRSSLSYSFHLEFMPPTRAAAR